MKRALFVGRFQPFHNGHLHVVREILKKYDEAIIVIGSAEESLSQENPFSAGERMEMIRQCFTEKELSCIILVPLRDINNNSLWVSHVCAHVPPFETVYTNNWLVKHLFYQAKISAQNIAFHDRDSHEATKIRNLIISGNQNWKKHVPKEIANWLVKNKAEERLRQLSKKH